MSTRRLRRMGQWTLMTAIFTAVLALGGIHKEAIVACAALSLLALGLTAWRSQSFELTAPGKVVLLGWSLIAGQLLPLPIGFVRLLAPNTAALRLGAAKALGLPAPTVVPLSLDPHSTALALVWMTAVLATLLTASRLASKPHRHLRWLAVTVPAAGVLVVIIGLVHAALGLNAVYGLFPVDPGALPSHTGASYVTSFINPNHAAALLVLGLCLCLGQIIDEDTPASGRVIAGIAAIILSLGLALSASRAGILTGALAALIMVSSKSARRIHIVVLVALIMVALVALMGPLKTELASLGDAHLINQTQRDTHLMGVEVAAAWPLTGAGRGAFPSAHTIENDGVSRLTISHAHNAPIQLLADFGLLAGGLLILLTILIGARVMTRAFHEPIPRAAVVGLAALGIHNLVDFNIDLLGVALPAALLLGLAAPRGGRALPWRPVVAITALLFLALVPAYLWTGLEAGPRRDAWIQQHPQEAARRYPADAYAFLAAGVAQRNDAELVFANRLHPSEANIPLARAQLTQGGDWIPLVREALSRPWAYKSQAAIFSVIHRRARTATEVLDALPPRGAMVARYIGWSRKTPYQAILRRALERFPNNPHVLTAIAEIRLAQNRTQEADGLATKLMIQGEPAGYRLLGEVMRRRGQYLEAYTLLVAAGDPDSTLKAASIALAMKDPQRALNLLAKARVSGRHLKRVQALRKRAREALRQDRL